MPCKIISVFREPKSAKILMCLAKILMCLTFTYMTTSLCIYLLKLVKGTMFCILHMLYILSSQ
jgi:hypothetical protein